MYYPKIYFGIGVQFEIPTTIKLHYLFSPIFINFTFCNMQSLCGHTSPIESVVFDSSEGLVVAGASTGVIKLWALEEAKSELMCSLLHNR